MKQILILLTVMVSVSAQEPVMVWGKQVDLYNDKGKIVKVLKYGEIVIAAPFDKDARRYEITVKDQKFNAMKSYFKKITEVVVIYKKSIIELEGRMKKNNLRISNINSDLLVRYIQLLELERDTALSYMKVVPVYSQGNNNQQYFRSFSTVLSSGKFKKLKREWTKDVKEITDEKDGLQTENQKIQVGLSNLKSKLGGFENLGKMIAGKGETDKELFVIRDGVELFKENKPVKVVNAGTVLMGHRHAQFNNWFDVSYEGDNFLVSSKFVVDSVDYYQSLVASKVTADLMIEQLNAEVQNQQFLLKLYQGVSRQLEADKFIQTGYGLAKNLIVPIDKTRTFTIKSPTADEVYVNTSRAERVLRDWKEEATELAKQSTSKQKKIVDLKKTLVDINTSLKKLGKDN